MSTKTTTWMAIISTPLGIWESTVCVCSGINAEKRATHGAQMLFMQQSLPPFMTKQLEYMHYDFWYVATCNDVKCIAQEIQIEKE
jgi:hypothetical protein